VFNEVLLLNQTNAHEASGNFDNVRANLISVLPRLQRYARNLTASSADADDLLQATSERVLSRWKQFQAGSDFDRWAFTIMHSIRSNQLRAESVRFGHGQQDAAETLVAPESDSPERNKTHQQVLDTIDRLPDGQRQVMLLVYVEGFSYSATAEMLDVPIGTVMSRIGRARTKLAADLNADSPRPALSRQVAAADKPEVHSGGVVHSTQAAKSVSSGRAGGSFRTAFKR
jgi:RNA polymerase sigma-70 factor (ECF subfamily)